MQRARQWFRDLLRDEFLKRYGRLCQREGPAHVVPPTDKLVDAFVDAMAPTWTTGSGPAVAAAVELAGEAYEYVVGRWPNARWRALVSIALDAGVRERESVPTDRVATRRHRSAARYSRDSVLRQLG